MVKVVVINESGSESTVAVSGSDKDIIGATIHRELNAASSAVLVFPPENPLSGILDTKNPVIAIYDGETQMFVGSVAGDISTDIWGRKTINLDGALSWLKNVCKPPFTVSNRTVEDYVSTIISQYNAGVAQNRRVTVGGITVPGYVAYNHNDEFTTIGELVAETVQDHGGYLSETFCGRGLNPRIDYFATALTEDPRPLVFGRDIEEFESVVNYDGYCSRVYAVGKDGITATAINSEAEKQYGRVDYPMRSDAETLEELQAEADAVLASRSVPVKTVTAKALAASGCIPGLVKKTIDYRRKIELSMMVYAVDIDLLDPSKNRAEFGLAPKRTFTSTHGGGVSNAVSAMWGTLDASFVAMPSPYNRTEGEIAAVAESYFAKRYFDGTTNFRFDYQTSTDRTTYGGDATYRTERFRLGMIDCSALAGLIIRGLDYDHSPYGLAYAAGGTKYQRVGSDVDGSVLIAPKTPGGTLPDFDPDSVRCNPAARWAINPRDYWCLGNYKTGHDTGDDDDEDSVPSTVPAQGRPVSAANLAQLLLTCCDVVPIKGGFSAIRKGDVLFWAGKNEDGTYKQPSRFLRINHVAVCCAVENGRHYYIDSVNDGDPIRKACLETDTPLAAYLILVLRLRQGKAWARLRILSPPEDVTVAEGSVQRFSCVATGDQVRYRWQYSDDNGATWNDSTLPHSSTVYPTISGDMDGRQYHCLCTDMHGRTLTSRAALITIGSPQTVTAITNAEIDAICT